MNTIKAIAKLGLAATVPSGMVLMGNGKTGKSLEGRIENRIGCPLMKREGDHFSAPLCPSCYAVDVLNNYTPVRQFLTGNHSAQEIIMRASGATGDVSGQPIMPGDRLRLYGITDFRPSHVATIKMLSSVYKLDIISKTLWHFIPCRQHLIDLAKLPGICISISFNRELGLAKLAGFKSTEENIEACRAFIRKHDLGKTVSLNYTFLSDYRTTGRSTIETYRRIPGIRVYHTVAKDKARLTAEIGIKGVCGMFDNTGRRIEDFSKTKASCLGCTFCRKGTAA